LLLSNIPAILELLICTIFNPNLTWTQQFAPLLGQEEVERLRNKLASLNLTGLEHVHLTYQQFFPSSTLEKDSMADQLMREIGMRTQDGIVYVLVSLLLLFCPDELDLFERRRVEKLQEKFATLLQKYLYYKHQSEPKVALSRFTSSLLLVSRCKEFAIITKRYELFN